MGFLDPAPTPYDPLEWEKRPFEERARMACQAWADDGYGAPLGIYAVYVLKVVAYVGGWLFFCTLGAGRTLANLPDWWLSQDAFFKAIVFSALFEGLGLGCGSGPLTARYWPPLGGFLYFLRPGTTKRPLARGLPILGGHTRTWLDVGLYAALLGALVAGLVAPALSLAHVAVILGLAGLVGVADTTIFLALRAEHYLATLACLLFAHLDGASWIAGAKAVALALWFWAGTSKLNHHFPAVVCVMMSNSPFTRIRWLRRHMYRSYPDDLRPSRAAITLAHAGTALELAVPLTLAWAPPGLPLLVGMGMVLALHGYITSNVPMGVPIEWNFMVVYGAIALFWGHPEVSVLDVGSVPLAAYLGLTLIGVPLLGNLAPRWVSFLLSMRYYAGNWAYSVWLFRGSSVERLERLVKSSPWIPEQLARFYDHRTAVGLVSKVLAFRLMHLHGRALPTLIPRAVPTLDGYEYAEGETIAGLVLGWNFGDGHLHDERLLETVQAQCGFSEGELRCIFVESQPLFRPRLAYRIHDAATGRLETGELDIAALRERQPWAGGPENSEGEP